MSSNQQERRVDGLTEKVIVAVKASREISKTALVWALTHVVQPGDCIILLVVVPPYSSGIDLPNLFSYTSFCCFSLSIMHWWHLFSHDAFITLQRG